MPTWPATLPRYCDFNSYRETPVASVVRSQMDSGIAKTRRRFTALITLHDWSVVLSAAEVDTFVTFFRSGLANGSLSFDGFVHPRTGAAVTARVMNATYTLQPDEPTPGAEARWRLTMQLEFLPG